jgi:hypothetical protein
MCILLVDCSTFAVCFFINFTSSQTTCCLFLPLFKNGLLP